MLAITNLFKSVTNISMLGPLVPRYVPLVLGGSLSLYRNNQTK